MCLYVVLFVSHVHVCVLHMHFLRTIHTTTPPPSQVYTYQELLTLARDTITTRHNAIAQGGREIAALLGTTLQAVGLAKSARAWREYVGWISNMVYEGLVGVVEASGGYIATQVCGCGGGW